jgi:lysylphosphatidylglycerol synthetase-like protein (DUF2156 family)
LTRGEPPAFRGADPSRAAVLELVRAHGADALSFVAVESGLQHWFDGRSPSGTGACVAYYDTKAAWVAACGPLCAPEERARTAARFVEAARARGRRACFFAADSLESPDLRRVRVGEQPVFRPRDWLEGLSGHRRLREQLRRARAKGVRVRRATAAELGPEIPLRQEVERLATAWLATRRLEPMGFVVAVEPFHHPDEHRYFVAEQGGRLVGFLSAVPIGTGRGWLIEDVFRLEGSPNGTTETLFHAVMQDVIDSDRVTLGPTPLAGDVAWPLRIVRRLARPLFDFDGLRAFRQRLHPHGWHPVWIVYPASSTAPAAIVDALRAFAGGSLTAFAVRSVLRHPSRWPWALALPLPAWILALAWIACLGRASLLGFSGAELWTWVAFDVLLLVLLLGAAMRPRRPQLLVAMGLAGIDAALSAAHVGFVGPGATGAQLALRALATGAPFFGAGLLAWAASQVPL